MSVLRHICCWQQSVLSNLLRGFGNRFFAVSDRLLGSLDLHLVTRDGAACRVELRLNVGDTRLLALELLASGRKNLVLQRLDLGLEGLDRLLRLAEWLCERFDDAIQLPVCNRIYQQMSYRSLADSLQDRLY